MKNILRGQSFRIHCAAALWVVISVLAYAAPLLADVSVSLSGPAGRSEQVLPGDSGNFDLTIPLTKNSVNTLTVTATDDYGNQASQDIDITQISYDSLVVATVTAEPLPPERVHQLVSDGVIDLDDPENYNVSQFNIVLTIGKEPVEISIPIPVPKEAAEESTGFETYKIPKGGDSSGRPKNKREIEIIVFEETPPSIPGKPAPPPIPGVIIIEGRIKTLKEFFSVKFLLMNTSGIFTLDEVSAELEFPDGGLSNVLPADGIGILGSIEPGIAEAPGQVEQEFIVRGDEKGVRGITVHFGGKVAGPGIPVGEEIPFNGSASTSIEVKGPPEFLVEVSHPDFVVAQTPYELVIDITNTGDTPALYTSFELEVGADADIVECTVSETGIPACTPIHDAAKRSIGHIMAGERVREVFTVSPHSSGAITSCLGIADQNISLKVAVGTIGCLVGQYPPNRGSVDGAASVSVVPYNNAFGVGLDAPVVGFFSAEMNQASITTGSGGTFNVVDPTGALVPGTIRFELIGGKTVAIWQVEDGVSNRFNPDTEYTVQITNQILDAVGNTLSSEWTGTFTTTTEAFNDTTPPEISLIVLPPVNPNAVVPGQVVNVKTYPVDQGSGISRVELRIKDASVEGSLYELVDQKFVSPSSLPPFTFAINSAGLIPGHTYQLRATAYDGMLNVQDAILALFIATSAPNPTIALPDDPSSPQLHGVPFSLTPVEVTGGVIAVRYYIDGESVPFAEVGLPPYEAGVSTKNLALGSHTIQAEVEDGLGQTGTDTYSFELVENLNPPTVSFLSPVDGSKQLQSSTFVINTEIVDPVGVALIEFFLDDTSGSPIYSGNPGFIIDASGLSLGVHTVYVRATNEIGVSNSLSDPSAQASFEIVDVIPGPPPAAPAISGVSEPADGMCTVNGTTSVAGGRVDVTNVSLGIPAIVYANGLGAYSATMACEGGQTIEAVAFDVSQTEMSPASSATVPIPKVLQSISVAPTALTFNSVGEYSDLAVTGTYDDLSTQDITDEAGFASNDTSVAAVNTSGRVAAQGPGTADITVTVGTFTETVSVNAPILIQTGIEVSPTTVSLAFISQTETLVVRRVMNDGSTPLATTGVSFLSSDPTVATVTSSGQVEAIGNGGTVVTVSMSGFTPVVVPVTVSTASDPKPTVSILSPSSGATVERGESVTVNIRAEDTLGGVTRVTLDVSGAASGSDAAQVSPPSLDTTESLSFSVPIDAAIGSTITLTAGAEDTSANTADPVSVDIVVGDETAPTVSIAAPAESTAYNYGDRVDITVDASDAVGVSRIWYQTEGALSFSDSETIAPAQSPASASFSFDIPFNVGNPDVTIRAFAEDEAGNSHEAVPVHIVLSDADITPPETVATAISDPGGSTLATVNFEVTSGLEDLDYVALYFRRDGIGTFNRYTDADGGNAEGRFQPSSGNTGSIDFDAAKMGGDGSYEFYTVGVDVAGNIEPAPDDGLGGVVPDQVQAFAAGLPVTVINANTVIGDGDTAYDDQNLLIDGATVTIDGAHQFRNIELVNGAVLTHSETDLTNEYALDISAWTLTVHSGTSLNVDARGYLGGFREGNDCTGQTQGNIDGSDYRTGGSYGGMGGQYDIELPAPAYGLLTNPAHPGGGGGCGTYDNVGGDGGGYIAVQAVNIVNDGMLSANGDRGWTRQAGSGAGGGILLTASTVSGTGTIRANGYAHEVGGGGGRIAVYYVDIATLDTSLLQALGGDGSHADGGNGTVFLQGVHETNGTLVVDGQGAASAFTSLPIPPGYVFDNIVIKNSARVIADDTLRANDEIRVEANSIVTHSRGHEAGLTLEAQRVFVDSSSSIDVSEKGYLGGLRDGNVVCEGQTLGGVFSAEYRTGASYGGLGGRYDVGLPNPAYGHPAEPVYLGSGGGCGRYSNIGGNGGGRVTINASRSVVVDGAILANGQRGYSHQAGSGSGGSIKIATSFFGGSGTVYANGYAHEVGGGGGRIAIVYDYLGESGNDFDGLRNVAAFGGHGSHARGSAGTVLFRRSDQSYGDLYIDDNRVGATTYHWTPLTHLGFGSITALSSNTLTTDGTVRMLPGSLVGLEINPDITQETTFVVTANDTDTLTVAASGTSLTDVASVGDTYAAVYRFDNLTFRRGGFLVLGDKLLVEDTVLIDEYGKLSHYDATMDFTSRIDLSAHTLDIRATASIDANTRGYLGGLRETNDCTGQTIGNTDGSDRRSGGSFGGIGGHYADSGPSSAYGSLTNPDDLGSGGGCGINSRAGGDGGGHIRLSAQNIIVDGSISADGAPGTTYQAGSGSGGTINIDAAMLSGTGAITASGYAHEVGGGGGRIAVVFDAMTFPDESFDVRGGRGGHARAGNGTLFLRQRGQLYGDLIVDGENVDSISDRSPIPGGYTFDNVIIRNQAQVNIDNGLTVDGTLTIENSSKLTHTQGSESGLSINVQHLVIDSTSAIDVSERGYLGGLQTGNPNCEGITLGGLSGAGYRAGGSYGGLGGEYAGAIAGSAYGHPAAPVYLGSGGGCGNYSNTGGNGGGLAAINASGSLTVEGAIYANGARGWSHQGGSGSGGSISITTSLLQGSGVIQARGFAHEVGGGGGRIAIVYDSIGADDFAGLTNIDAAGGNGSHADGSAGTVLLRQSSQLYGDLYIDEVRGSTGGRWTPLTHIGFGEVQALTADTITFDGLVSIIPGALVGLEINPNISQSTTFTILSNTETTATVAVGGTALTDLASVGDAYSGVYTFDNLYFRRGGFMVIGDKLKISNELRVDEQGVLTHYGAALDWISQLDIETQLLTITETGAINVDGRGYLGGMQGGNDCTGQTLGNVDGSAERAAGSHGGLGGNYSTGLPNPIYGSETNPIDLGSGGGCGLYDEAGGNGGGRISINASDIVCNGTVSADGNRGMGRQAGSGSGGSINITTGSLSGSGSIGADGYAHEVGGGGGRVAVRYSSGDFPPANITAAGGNGAQADGTDGTVHIE